MTVCAMNAPVSPGKCGEHHACDCHGAAAAGGAGEGHRPHSGHSPASSRLQLTTASTLHCLSGCAIGEFLGLALGVLLGLPPGATMLLATALGFASGYALGLWPLVQRGARWRDAFRQLWLGETISIAAMELAMNVTDYHVGGMGVSSLTEPRFWVAYALALVAGFAVAWPVNWWLLGRGLRHACH